MSLLQRVRLRLAALAGRTPPVARVCRAGCQGFVVHLDLPDAGHGWQRLAPPGGTRTWRQLGAVRERLRAYGVQVARLDEPVAQCEIIGGAAGVPATTTLAVQPTRTAPARVRAGTD